MKRVIRSNIFESSKIADKYKVYSAEDEVDEEFGDVDDIQLSGDVEEDFQKIVDILRDTSYEDLGPALEDIVDDPKLYTLLAEGFGSGDLANVKMSSSTTAIPVANYFQVNLK